MSVRRSRVTPLVGAGAAGLALAFAGAPQAIAHQAPQATSSPAGPAGSGAARANPQPNDPSTTTISETPTSSSSSPADSCETVSANYGYQKFRVGVQIKDGSVVPPDTNTVGSELTITETGPCALNGSSPGTETYTCSTETISPVDEGSTATYCTFNHNDQDGPPFTADIARAKPRISDIDFSHFYVAAPGDTVTITQTKWNSPNLLNDTSTTVLPPAETACNNFYLCTGGPTHDDVLFNDPAPGPDAVNDCTINVAVGKSALIDVEANDKPNNAPITALTVADPPTAGTAKVVGTKIRYTPDGTADTDSFRYQITTANGSSQAKVCLAISGVAATTSEAPSTSSAPPTTASATPTTNSLSPTTVTTTPPLANTGTPTGSLTGVGIGLVVVGGAATAVGVRRRRPRGRHA